MSENVYRNLQKHLNTLPVGFPRTITGAEIKLLKHMFDIAHARLACFMTFKPESAEEIYNKLDNNCLDFVKDPDICKAVLMDMASRGSILYNSVNESFALVPFVVGMYEFQLKNLTTEFLDATTSFGYQGFGLEYLTTHKPQSRIIPLDIRIENNQKIATYNEYRHLIKESEGRLAVLPCICRTASDAMGKPCRHSDERNLCLALRDYADMAVREGIGTALSVDEALDMAERNLEAGLVLQCTNDQTPQFICACCDDCCGLLGMIKASPSPVDHIASAYALTVNNDLCIACGLCVIKCPMDALSFSEKRLTVNYKRCIGCGVCTGVCKKEAIMLTLCENADIPPPTMEDYHNILAENKSGSIKKLKLAGRIAVKMGKDLFSKS